MNTTIWGAAPEQQIVYTYILSNVTPPVPTYRLANEIVHEDFSRLLQITQRYIDLPKLRLKVRQEVNGKYKVLNWKENELNRGIESENLHQSRDFHEPGKISSITCRLYKARRGIAGSHRFYRIAYK